MSYLNINYSTLEDAWGKNFDKKKRQKSNVCELYNRRNAGSFKPYKTVMESDFIKPIYKDEDYTKYYGYKDGRPFGRPKHRVSTYDVSLPSFTKSTAKYLEDDEIDEEVYDEEVYDEDDDIELTNSIYGNSKYRNNYIPPIKKSRPRSQRSFRHINDVARVYKETPFSYLEEAHSTPNRNSPILVQQEDDDDFEEDDVPSKISPTQACNDAYLQEVDYDSDFDGYFKSDFSAVPDLPSHVSKESGPPKKNIKSQYEKMMRSAVRENFEQPGAVTTKSGGYTKERKDDRVHLDLALYTISGIILIFVMEQFVQIGLKIKR